jgi:nitrogen fixation protein NifB
VSATRISVVDVMRRHPCFDEQAHDRVGRMHLPVAPRCNIQCRFCERRICANLTMQHPGWARELLSPADAVAWVGEWVRRRSSEVAIAPEELSFVVGVAGPGEPLANEGTFEALARVHAAFPKLMTCISTNGLLLEYKLPALLDVGVTALTVTVNAPDAEVGQHIYAWVRYQGVLYRGREAAEVLIDSQVCGIRAALAAGLAVKVNTVLIPGVNDMHVTRVAERMSDLGVHLMNIMPLIPGGQMKDLSPPTCDELMRARLHCAKALPQFHKCKQCRADIVCFP